MDGWARGSGSGPGSNHDSARMSQRSSRPEQRLWGEELLTGGGGAR